MSDIKVSIIIPIYNPGEELINSMNSIIGQNLESMEIICINDGSSDNSLDLLEHYAKRDSRIRIINQENSGAGIARNNGIEHAKGEYLLFLDSDDWLEENTCELLYHYAKMHDADLVLFNCLIHEDNDNLKELVFLDETYENKIFDYKNIQGKIFNGPLGVIWNKFYKTDFLKENKIIFPDYKLFNDVEFHIKCMTLADRITFFNNIFYHYNNITHFSLQKSYVGTGDSTVFYDVMMDVMDFLNSNNRMEDCRERFLNFSFFEFKIKLENIDSNYRHTYFLNIKDFFKSMNITADDFKELNCEYFLFYICTMNSDSYDEFELMNNQLNDLIDDKNEFNEYIVNNQFNKDNIDCNELLIKILENNIGKQSKDYFELKKKLIN